MIERELTQHLKKLGTWYPVVAVTGPRQSGKTTLVKATFEGYEYINLELPSLRQQAQEDPFSFINNRPSKLIIDEAQLAPELFSAIQVVSDERNVPGQYVLSGSQNFLLAKNIKQSLAGRCAYVELLPLSFFEVKNNNAEIDIWDFAHLGGYPRLYDVGIPANDYYLRYLKTYVERDVKECLDVRNVKEFDNFIKVLASQTANLLNVSSISKACKMSVNTAKSWLGILEGSYITFRLHPYFSNIKKRLTKTPKIYFYDTGLLCHLLGIKSASDLKLSEHKGVVIENLVVSETIKMYSNEAMEANVFFYRDDSKIEIDMLDFSDSSEKKAYEIKSSGLYHDKYAKNLLSVAGSLGVPQENQQVLLDTEKDFKIKGVNVGSIENYLMER